MDFAGAVLAQGGHVHGRAIAHVALEAIGRKLFGILQHQAVPYRLGEDGGRGNGGVLVVTADDGFDAHAIQPWRPVAIDAYVARPRIQPLDGTGHGQQRGTQDVEPVDLLDAGTGHGKGQRPFTDLGSQPLTTTGAELLGVTQPLDGMVGVQDDGRGHHRPGQRTTTGLIDAGDGGVGHKGEIEGGSSHARSFITVSATRRAQSRASSWCMAAKRVRRRSQPAASSCCSLMARASASGVAAS